MLIIMRMCVKCANILVIACPKRSFGANTFAVLLAL